MKREWIVQVPTVHKNTYIHELVPLLREQDALSDYLLLTDDGGQLAGYVKTSYLLRFLQVGTTANWTVEAVAETQCLTVKENRAAALPVAGRGSPVIVVGKGNRPLGVLDETGYLLERLQERPGFMPMRLSSPLLGVILLDSDDRILDINETARNLLGYKGKGVGRHMADLWEQYSRKQMQPKGTGTAPLGEREVRWLLLRDVSEGMLLCLSDASEHRSLQTQCESLKKRVVELEEIIEHSYDEIHVTDQNGVCILANQACERIYGMKKEEIIGKTSKQILREGIISSVLADRIIEHKRRLTDIQCTRVGQRILATGNPVFDDDGNVKRVVINSRELSEMSDFVKTDSPNGRPKALEAIAPLARSKLLAKGIVAESPAILQCVDMVQRVAQLDTNVLLLGETGVGKGCFANLIHELSARCGKNFIKVNCAAIPEPLLESELFGYSKGAFTGARATGKPGLFQLADGGTIFLDEIGDLPLSGQAKLLQVIQDKEFFPVGGSAPVRCDFRIIAATNKELSRLVRAGIFREDLYYRLSVFPIRIPPLRERRKDIPYLVQGVITRFNKDTGRYCHIGHEAMSRLVAYDWPGNIRQLENAVEQLLIVAKEQLVTTGDMACLDIQNAAQSDCPPDLGSRSLKEALEQMEKKMLWQAMQSSESTYDAARILQINQSTVVRKMMKYGLKFDNAG